jgi:AraC-like DNA-binding protein
MRLVQLLVPMLIASLVGDPTTATAISYPASQLFKGQRTDFTIDALMLRFVSEHKGVPHQKLAQWALARYDALDTAVAPLDAWQDRWQTLWWEPLGWLAAFLTPGVSVLLTMKASHNEPPERLPIRMKQGSSDKFGLLRRVSNLIHKRRVWPVWGWFPIEKAILRLLADDEEGITERHAAATLGIAPGSLRTRLKTLELKFSEPEEFRPPGVAKAASLEESLALLRQAAEFLLHQRPYKAVIPPTLAHLLRLNAKQVAKIIKAHPEVLPSRRSKMEADILNAIDRLDTPEHHSFVSAAEIARELGYADASYISKQVRSSAEVAARLDEAGRHGRHRDSPQTSETPARIRRPAPQPPSADPAALRAWIQTAKDQRPFIEISETSIALGIHASVEEVRRGLRKDPSVNSLFERVRRSAPTARMLDAFERSYPYGVVSEISNTQLAAILGMNRPRFVFRMTQIDSRIAKTIDAWPVDTELSIGNVADFLGLSQGFLVFRLVRKSSLEASWNAREQSLRALHRQDAPPQSILFFEAIWAAFAYLGLMFPLSLWLTQDNKPQIWEKPFGREHISLVGIFSFRVLLLFLSESLLYGRPQTGGPEEPGLFFVKNGRLHFNVRGKPDYSILRRSLGWMVAIPTIVLSLLHETLHVALSALPNSLERTLNRHSIVYPLEAGMLWILIHHLAIAPLGWVWIGMAAFHGVLALWDRFRGGGASGSSGLKALHTAQGSLLLAA